MALQQYTAQLTDKYNHLSAEYAQLKASQAQQRAESEQIKASQAQQTAESEQQKAAYEQFREMVMNMATHSGTCAPNPFWPYNH
jgi:septal ring factor EnvC (AmiA/AmiB activator)